MTERLKLNRREFLKKAAIAGGGIVSGGGLIYLLKKAGERYERYLLGPLADEIENEKQEEVNRAEQSDGFQVFEGEFEMPELFFPEIPETKQLSPSEWSQKEFIQEWDRRIQEAQENNGTTEIQLPEGEVFIGQKMLLEVPEGVKVVIRGHENGSRFRLAEELSFLPDPEKEKDRSWEGHEFNLMEILLGQNAKITLENLEFDGGSSRAGLGGYQAPVSPWNTILGIYGNSPTNEPGSEAAGSAEIRDCLFRNSEAPGLVVQNLEKAVVEDCQGKRLDTLVAANWNRKTRIENCHTKDCLSDAFFAVVCQDLKMVNCTANVARQGFNIHGGEEVLIDQCLGRHCAEFITISRADVNQKWSRGVVILDSHSVECNFIYAIQFAENVEVYGGRHDQAGEWWRGEDFLHKGIANFKSLGKAPVWINWGTTRDLEFRDIEIRKSATAPEDYRVDKRPEGVVFIAN